MWKNTESKNPKVAQTKNRRIMLLGKYEVYDSKKSKFIKEKKPLSNKKKLSKKPLSKIILVGQLLF